MTTSIVASNASNAIDYTREQIDTIRNTVARGANDAQLALFLQVCKSRSLDPFSRQVHWTSQGIIVGIDGLRAIADRTDRYVPGNTQLEFDDKGGIVAAHVTVKKLVAGSWHEITESAYMVEYSGRSPIWSKMPRVMLSKCAEARALRRAFPADMSGLYAQEEMDQAGVTISEAPVAVPVAQPVAQPKVTAPKPAPAPVAPAAPADVVEAEVVEAEAGGAAARVRSEVESAATVADGCAVMKTHQPILSDEDLCSIYGTLLKKCRTVEEANDTARMVLGWKNAKAISPKAIETLRNAFSSARAALSGN